MPEMRRVFDDGSCIVWQDRESLLYEEGERSVLAWVDYEPGLLRRGRVIRLDSLRYWRGTDAAIAPEKRAEIVAKIVDYLGGKVRAE